MSGSCERMETGSSPSTGKEGGKTENQVQAKGKCSLEPLKVGDPVLVQDLPAKKTEWMQGYCRGQLSDTLYTVEVNGQLLHSF